MNVNDKSGTEISAVIDAGSEGQNIEVASLSPPIDFEAGLKLKVYKKRYVVATILGRNYATFIKIIPTENELQSIRRGRLRSCQIQTSEGGSISKAFNFQLNRVRNRWNVAIKRSTGFVLFDTVWALFSGLLSGFKAVVRMFVGTRTRFSDLLEGVEFRSRTIEQQRETETMVFASIAAVMRAAHFTSEGSSEILYLDNDYMEEVKGLTFTGGMVGTMGVADDNDDSDDDDGENSDDFDMDDMDMDDLDVMEMV